MSHYAHRRPQLATQLCDSLEGKGLVNARSGLFLAARRRVGKTTFLREDLIPAIESRQWLPIYKDLWEDKSIDPAVLLGDAIKTALAKHDGALVKAARAMRLSKVTVAGVSMDLGKPGLPDGVSVADALEALADKAQRPIVLIVDEAQHALTTEKGETAMFGLKAARDRLNTSDRTPRLMLVMTGSNRDKLAHLVIKKDQPFFGSRVTPFPLLDRDYTDPYTAFTNRNLAPGNQLVPEDVYAAFRLVGHRPERLWEIIGDIALAGDSARLNELLKAGAAEWHERIWGEYEHAFNGLTALQQSVLEVMATKQGSAFAPFAEDSMEAYRLISGDTGITASSIQSAIDTLRERDLVWREARGAYALEDEGFAEWIMQRRANLP